MTSLRKKIFRTYGYSKLVMLVFAAVVFVDLFYLNRQIESGQAVTDFREASLEMRRDEKNLFLYRDLGSLDQLLTPSRCGAGRAQ
jgi:two-component system, NtrC family, sensor kinase